jgi:putative DNA primase/helicase
VNGIMNLLKAMTTVSVSVFDQHPDHVNALNGVIDLKTGQLLDHNPAWYFTYTMQANYNPAAPYSEWLQFLNGVTDPETVTFLKTAMGYSLTGHTREEKMFYIFGPTRSGKGTFTETLMTLLGKEPLCTETSFETFTADRSGDTQNFDLAPLKPCRVVFASESNKYQSLNPAVVKRLTGGNDIRCAFKRKDHFTYRPQFKLWLSSNEPVHADPDDDAAWARLIVVTFPNSFLGQEDTTLKQRLKEPTALEGALRWCVEGAQEWYANGLQQPVAIVQETKRHRDEQDYVQQFIDECCSVSPAHFVSNADLYPAYVQFMNDEIGLRPKSKRYLNRTLKKKGFILDHNTAKTKRGVWGISLKP